MTNEEIKDLAQRFLDARDAKVEIEQDIRPQEKKIEVLALEMRDCAKKLHEEQGTRTDKDAPLVVKLHDGRVLEISERHGLQERTGEGASELVVE